MQHDIKHLAIIMDGNASWASQHNLPTSAGHTKGAEVAKDIITGALKFNIPYLTLFAFSSENWQRPNEEILIIIDLLKYYIESEQDNIKQNKIRIKIVGDISRLEPRIQESIKEITKATAAYDAMTLAIAFSYGGRQEILDACRQMINDGVNASEVNEQLFSDNLYDPEMPDLDLLVRTSGQLRVSNFLLWQLAYAEINVSPKNWPDYNQDDLKQAIIDYSQRERKFGQRMAN